MIHNSFDACDPLNDAKRFIVLGLISNLTDQLRGAVLEGDIYPVVSKLLGLAEAVGNSVGHLLISWQGNLQRRRLACWAWFLTP
jgi:hypothetical protein